MNEHERIDLETEISRQRSIIDALILQNRVLQQKINDFNAEKGTTDSSYSVVEKAIGTTNVGYSLSEKGNGTTNVGYSVAEKVIGTANVGYSLSEKGNGTTNVSYSVVEKDIGTTNVGYSVSEKDKGITDLGYSLPVKIEPNEVNWRRLAVSIRASGIKGSSHGSLKKTAQLLIHFYNESGGGYPVFKKLTGLSTGGVGKQLMVLKKRGWVTRTALQQYALSGYARQMVAQAVMPPGK